MFTDQARLAGDTHLVVPGFGGVDPDRVATALARSLARFVQWGVPAADFDRA